MNGTRYTDTANIEFRMPEDDFEKSNMESPEFINQIENYIQQFRNNQLPRLQELKRYYLSDNNIKYRDTKRDKNRADNRIASDWAKYITVFMQGYILGNPVKYQNEDAQLVNKIEEFQNANNEDYHNGLLETDLSIYGRAYEMLYIDSDGIEKVTKLSPEQTFVVYGDTIEKNSLFGVRFYQIEFSMEKAASYVEVYTDNEMYRYETNNNAYSGLAFKEKKETNFKGVPINEYQNNEDRLGDFESVLDSIDAYDLSQSELANFQQDSSDAYLVITGNPMTATDTTYEYDSSGKIVLDEYGKPVVADNSKDGVLEAMMKARLLVLDNNNNPDGPNPNAFYLTKEYDSTGVEAYKKRLVDDILRFTFTPDTNDSNFSGTQSGESMKYKLMGNDNLNKTKTRLLTKGFMRRLRLLANVWSLKNSVSTGDKITDLQDKINDTTIKFTPNLPQNDEERINMIKNLDGVVSDETLLTLLETFTGVDASNELKRIDKESDKQPINSNPRIPNNNDGVNEVDEHE